MSEIIQFGDRKYTKTIGDEGQDVYVSHFLDNEKNVLGKFVDENSYDLVVDNDADFYLPSGDISGSDELTEDRCAFKFRKNVFTLDEQKGAFKGLYDAARESFNRGNAAGPREETEETNRDWVSEFQQDILAHYERGQPKSVDGTDPIELIREKHANDEGANRGNVWLRVKLEKEFGAYKNFFPKCMDRLAKMEIAEASSYAKKIRQNFISDTTYATTMWSGIAGYYGRYPRIPYGRPTAYTEQNPDLFAECFPFARKLESEFKRLLPARWQAQKAFADRLDNKFLIGGDTTFTTITVNTTTKDRNARMACHRDQGSLNPGFSNLLTITKDGKDWDGGYLVTPEVRAAINCRPGDLLLIDNMRIIHGNSPINPPKSGLDDFLRMSLVFYFREDMDKLGSYEYESLRRKFVDTRKRDETHPNWKPFWNGVSASMWDEIEWHDYLMKNGGEEMMLNNQNELWEKFNAPKATLEGFF